MIKMAYNLEVSNCYAIARKKGVTRKEKTGYSVLLNTYEKIILT